MQLNKGKYDSHLKFCNFWHRISFYATLWYPKYYEISYNFLKSIFGNIPRLTILPKLNINFDQPALGKKNHIQRYLRILWLSSCFSFAVRPWLPLPESPDPPPSRAEFCRASPDSFRRHSSRFAPLDCKKNMSTFFFYELESEVASNWLKELLILNVRKNRSSC